ncbi:hypothetical protein HRR83_005865 [Exophiala dermatitidis]|uniref:Rhodopsin domain-containing protein n=2 Tax=Exophiala dermatitidis TaxID=5970 RepID=H6BUK0_EXODN|nr:uncharacterized protein HMPREF1120_03037 [Exophiala dermatitidis NIH/UT8656]KAJ4508773.1 hypothetical protein HRR73_007442 [Exophiala dermatitidis]EHY54875.1 hypothetical protein HMPREF1120_03037 [Exophiala dermatitidis NIH/UT8656]KAJ4513420.1 hypothetical protein HRR74_006234 [Exophiala dermatitidis]KAJ4538024.1 hypothetical protein HRR77_007066 [Exophiala dermatitidis]KAJ4539755.1 hypothetical protein HRR76_003193 [Exophiala dermatitidis]
MSSTDSKGTDPVDAPFQSLSKDSQGPWLIVCAYVCILLTVMTIFIKLFTRFKATNRLTANDCFILTAGFLGIVQTITITVAVHCGLGQRRRNLSQFKFETFEKTIYASNILIILVVAASKASVTHLIIAINPTRTMLMCCYALLGFIAAWTFASIFASAFQCNPPNPWNSEGNKCVDQFALNVAIHTLNILSDVLIVLIPFAMMLKVKVTSHKRFIVTGLFASRFAAVPFTVTMLVYMRTVFRSAHPDITWDYLVPQVFATIMINTSIIASCIPSLKPFLHDIKPGLIVVNVPEDEFTASYVRHSRNRSGLNGRTFGSGGISRIRNKLGLSSRTGHTLTSNSGNSSGMWAEKQKQVLENMELGYNRPQATKARSKVEMDRSESVKGLTDDVILHTIDYKVEYEDPTRDPDVITDHSGSSHRRERS